MLKQRSVTANILTAIPAVLLSMLLILCLIVTALYGVVLQTTSAESISKMTRTVVTQMVEQMDFEEVILSNEVVKDNIEELGITADVVGEIMQSAAAGEVIDLLAADAANLLTDTEEAPNLTAEALVRIVKTHADDLAQIAADMIDDPDSKEELKAQIIQVVEEDAEAMTAALPDMESLRVTVTQQVPVDQIARWLNITYLLTACGVCFVLAALIYACRYYRFGGFLWLGVDFLLAGAAVVVGAYAIRTVGGNVLANAGDAARLLTALMQQLIGTIETRGWIFLGLAVLLIVGYVLLYTLVVKKKLAASAEPVAATNE